MKIHSVFRSLLAVAALFVAALTFSMAAAEESTPPARNLIFILDSSGSMWGRIEGDLPKISVAKSVMTDLISGLDDKSSVGLIAYGHRRKGDCSDVETLTPLQPLNKDRLIGQIEGINPKGKTPITRSVKEAVDILRTVEESAGIVLVSDGIETCEGDPCEAVKAAKAAGIPFTMHVVGFDVAEAETDQLRCMADAGGGRYFTARNTAQLSEALKTAVEAPPAQPQSRLRVEVRVNGDLGRAEIDVYETGDGKRIGRDRTDRREEENPIGFALEPGEYDVTVRAIDLDESPEQKRTGIVVPDEETVTERFEFGSGKFQLTATVNDKLAKADVDIYEAGTNHKVAGDYTGRRDNNNPAIFTLQPGTYDVTVEMVDMDARPERKIEGIVIEPGKTVTEHMEFGSGTFQITATVNDKLSKADVDIYEAGTNHKVAGDYTGRREDNNPSIFTLQPGTYDVTVEMVDMDARPERKLENIVIEPGKTVTEHMEFGSGTFQITATVNDKLAKADVDIYEAGTNHKVAGDYTGRREKNNPSTFTLQPGTYDVTVEMVDMDARPERKIEGIVIEPGKTVTEHMEFGSGTFQITATVNDKLAKADVDIYEAGTNHKVAGDYTGRRDNNNPAIFTLQPGTYDATVEMVDMDARPERKIEGIVIEPGKTVAEHMEFGSGTFQITATVNDKLAKADVDIYEAGTNHKVAGDYTGRREKNNPATFTVEPGEYDVTVEILDMDERPEEKLEGIAVEKGQTIQKEIQMAAGTLKVKATFGGELGRADIDVYKSGTRNRVAGGRTRRSPEKNPLTFTLKPGAYDIKVEMRDAEGRPTQSKSDVIVETEGTSEHHFEF